MDDKFKPAIYMRKRTHQLSMMSLYSISGRLSLCVTLAASPSTASPSAASSRFR